MRPFPWVPWDRPQVKKILGTGARGRSKKSALPCFCVLGFRFQRGNQVAQRNIVRSAAVDSRLVLQDRESVNSRLNGS